MGNKASDGGPKDGGRRAANREQCRQEAALWFLQETEWASFTSVSAALAERKKKSNRGDHKKQEHPSFSVFPCDYNAHAGAHERFACCSSISASSPAGSVSGLNSWNVFTWHRLESELKGGIVFFDCCRILLASAARMRNDTLLRFFRLTAKLDRRHTKESWVLKSQSAPSWRTYWYELIKKMLMVLVDRKNKKRNKKAFALGFPMGSRLNKGGYPERRQLCCMLFGQPRMCGLLGVCHVTMTLQLTWEKHYIKTKKKENCDWAKFHNLAFQASKMRSITFSFFPFNLIWGWEWVIIIHKTNI